MPNTRRPYIRKFVRDLSETSLLPKYAHLSSKCRSSICNPSFKFAELVTDTNGFIVRDESRREIVVAFRGTDVATLTDYITGPCSPSITYTSGLSHLICFCVDAQVMLAPYESPGVSGVPNATAVHLGFLNSYNSVASLVISIVRTQLELHPDYNVVCTGDF